MKTFKNFLTEATNYREVARTILSQLGGGKFQSMTGAKNFVFVNDGLGGLKFEIPTKNKIKYVRIILNGKDLYDVQYLDNTGKQLYKSSDLYAEDLQDDFTTKTGMFTSLGEDAIAPATNTSGVAGLDVPAGKMVKRKSQINEDDADNEYLDIKYDPELVIPQKRISRHYKIHQRPATKNKY